LHVVANRLGRKDSSVTSVIYAHVLKKQEVGAVSAVIVQGVVKNSLLYFECFKRESVSGFLTKREVARCTSIGSAMLTRSRN
jgi:hypothetical protein